MQIFDYEKRIRLIKSNFKKDYMRLLEIKNKYSPERNIMESFILTVIAIINFIVSFFAEKVEKYIFISCLKAGEGPIKDSCVCNNKTRENPQKTSLLTELRFCKTFYTPA
ncbi:hypothetical protein [Candidatus Proelusimicrobium excrementi]|uniref:hypothetical protein n=1 Tax=Candidatus Proelusimicrobium excrementi TaxID=3416222 RepID=UPI003D139DE5